MNRETNLLDIFHSYECYLRRNVHWLTRGAILLVFGVLLLQKISSDTVSKIGGFFGLADPSLATILGLVALIFLIERVVVLETRLSELPLNAFQTRVDAYRELSRILRMNPVRKVDLLQFSGQTALPVIRAIAETSQKAAVRLLLCHPEHAKSFDTDNHPSHAARISASIESIEIIEEDYQGFSVDVRYYKSPAGVSIATVDDRVVSLGWYYFFLDKQVVRLRGHNAPAVTAADKHATPFVLFAQDHFDKLWTIAEPARGNAA